MSALALTLEASAARLSASEVIRSRLGEALKRHEAAVVDPTASLKRRVEAWQYLSAQAANMLLKGSPLSGGTTARDQDESFFISDDVAEASVAAVGDANLPLETRIEALRVVAVIAQFYSAAGRLRIGRDLFDNVALGAEGDDVGPVGASVVVRLATPKALQSYASIVAAAGDPGKSDRRFCVADDRAAGFDRAWCRADDGPRDIGSDQQVEEA